MSTRYYPLYQIGNPQLRIFLPNFWMKIVRPKEPLPPNMVLFQTSLEMTKYDVKNYLEKIYKVPVVEVKTTVKSGKIKKCFEKQNLIKEEDYKEALVTLPRDISFSFPNVTTSEESKKKKDKYLKLKEDYEKKSKTNNNSLLIPGWFSGNK